MDPTMWPLIKERLITGLAYYRSAQAGGSYRFAIAEAYLAMDNYFTALLFDMGTTDDQTIRNHRRKLHHLLDRRGDLFKKASVTRSELEEFYDSWQQVRYSTKAYTPNETIKFIKLSGRVIDEITSDLASKYDKTYEQLEDEINAEVQGDSWYGFDEEMGHFYEHWDQRAAELRDRGLGSKLSFLLLNPGWHCEMRAFADDKMTKEIIANNPEFGSKVTDFYMSFLNLIGAVQEERGEEGIEPEEIPNFMLSLRLSYHGQSTKEIVEDWGKKLSEFPSFRKLRRIKNQDEKDESSSNDL